MARTKKTSNILENAQTRLAALSSIDPKLNLDTGPRHQRLRCQDHLYAPSPRYLQPPALAGGRGL